MPILGSSQEREGQKQLWGVHRWPSGDQEQKNDHHKVTLAYHTQSHSQCWPREDPAWGQSSSCLVMYVGQTTGLILQTRRPKSKLIKWLAQGHPDVQSFC